MRTAMATRGARWQPERRAFVLAVQPDNRIIVAAGGSFGTPSSFESSLRDDVRSVVSAMETGTYCAGTTSLGLGFAVAPADSITQRCESKLTDATDQVFAGLLKCQAKLAGAEVGGKTSDAAACIAATKQNYDKTVLGLTGCPGRASGGRAHGRALIERAVLRGLGEVIYCGGSSPL